MIALWLSVPCNAAALPESLQYPMTKVDPGTFTMGGGWRSDEHTVTLTKGFSVGTVEVTQRLWMSVMGINPVWEALLWDTQVDFYDSPAKPENKYRLSLAGRDLPVFDISWCDALVFANRLSERDGLTPAYRLPEEWVYWDDLDLALWRVLGVEREVCLDHAEAVVWDRSADGYRLPTEAEWEYVARAEQPALGTLRWARKSCEVANVRTRATERFTHLELWWRWYISRANCEDGFPGLAPVGSLAPNAWGVHDMFGNVAEWCWDRFARLSSAPQQDPVGPEEGLYRSPRRSDEVVAWERAARGGNWESSPRAASPVGRRAKSPSSGSGLRLGRSLSR